MNCTAMKALDDAILQRLSSGRTAAKELNQGDVGLRNLADPLRKKSAWHGGQRPAMEVIKERLQALRQAGLIWFDGVGWQLVDTCAQARPPTDGSSVPAVAISYGITEEHEQRDIDRQS